MSRFACVHRITGSEESYCFLQSNRLKDDGTTRELMFHGARPGYPAWCDRLMALVCPFRDGGAVEEGRGGLLPCPYCHRRHRSGSTAKRLCEDWHSVKDVLKEMRARRLGGRLYLEEGTTLLPYRPDTPDLVRQLIWMRLKGAIVRRDRFTCQDCGEAFGRTRRKVYEPNLRSGRGGYRWESLEVHHIVPRSRGGSDHPGNLKTLCPSCHRGYTSELRQDSMEARRREEDIVCRMSRCEKEEVDWDPPIDD
jgi:5-methylcytosine-specific restriction protein A